MKKKLIFILLFICIVFYTNQAIASSDNIQIFVNDSLIKTIGQPFIQNGIILSPVSGIINAFNPMVTWNLAKKTLKINTYNKEIILKINNNKATINGKTVNIDVPAQYNKGNVFIPLRFICDAIGASMNWDPNKRVVNIHYLKPLPKTYNIEIKGDENFIDKTKKALKLLEVKDPDTYKLVKSYIGVIEQNKSSDQQSVTSTMFPCEEPPRFQFSDVTVNESTTWYASAIAHNSMHSKFCRTCYNDYDGAIKIDYKKVPVDFWTGHDAEMECLKYQIKVLEKISAPENEINFVKSFLGTDCVLFF